MQYYVLPIKRNSYLPSDAVFPCITLMDDLWDDYTYKTLFYATYWEREGQPTDLGQVKFLRMKDGEIQKRTKLPERFTTLSSDYCSLGQEKRYYERLSAKDPHAYRDIFTALRDVVYDPAYAAAFKDSEAFRVSMLRFAEAEYMWNFGGREFFGRFTPEGEPLVFTFTHQVEGFAAPHVIECDFTPRQPLPHRVLAFIGKNATGKTAAMAAMASDLAGTSRSVTRTQMGTGIASRTLMTTISRPPQKFSPSRPDFSRTVVVSYSPFGPFQFPAIRTSSYRYCGFLNQKGLPDRFLIDERIRESVEYIL